jgi:16S rRNA (uracil1498-N3)-methyltransferase
VKQFVLPAPPDAGGIIRLYGKDYHYLVRVRRLGEGSVFNALLHGGTGIRVTILSIADNMLTGECGRAVPADPSPLPSIYLFQALPKGNKMDLIVRQAAEGGITGIVPFESEYSAVRIKADPAARPIEGRADSGGKLRRWERIIREARQQSGSPVRTAVRAPCTLDGLFSYWTELKAAGPGGVGIFLHQDPLEQGTFHDYLYGKPDFTALAVGPEGGFSPAETGRFKAAGFVPLVMGNTILRTETAALYGAAAVRIILLENASWTLKTPRPLSPAGSGSNS